jgi:DNA polymerase III epsilon subunit-like protein
MVKLFEHKFWGKSIGDLLEWIEVSSKSNWIFLDIETTGLKSDPYEIQITQISCISTKFNLDKVEFQEVETFNKKIKLTDKTKSIFGRPDSRVKKILSFNRYGQKGTSYQEEDLVLDELSKFIQKSDKLVIQNASFDMGFLNTRSDIRFKNEVIDTKQIIQLFFIPTIQKLSETDPKYKDMIDKIGTSGRDSGLISSSMGKIGPALGINMTGYHDGLVDCRLTMDMMSRIIRILKENQKLDISQYQSQRIKIIK